LNSPDFKQEVSVAGGGVVESGGGDRHSCLLDDQQNVKCSGDNGYGQAGGGEGSTSSTSFTTVSGLAAASTISVGGHSSCAMLSLDASIHCWGHNVYGTLGNGGTANVFVPGAATELNTGSANVQLITSIRGSTYVITELIFH
jgi:alpha-tubulin suppressor-like RCC1 family protein